MESSILIVDRENLFAHDLANKLPESVTIVVVSSEAPDPSSSIVYIPYRSVSLQIPEGAYLHIVVVWDEKVHELLAPLEEKAKQLHAKLFFVGKKEMLLSEDVTRSQAVKIVIGDLFANNRKNEFLDEWLKNIKKSQKVVLPNMGLNVVYPIAFQDAIEKIISCMFSNAQKGETYLLYGPHPYTFLSLTHALQKIDPLIQIDLQTKEESRYETLIKGEYLFSASYNSTAALQQAYKNLPAPDRTNQPFFPAPPSYGIEKTKKKKWVGVTLYTIFVVLFFPIIVMVATGGLGLFFLTTSIFSLEKGSTVRALALLTSSQQDFSLAKAAGRIVVVEAGVLGQQKAVNDLLSESTTGQQIGEGLSGLINGYQKLSAVLMGKTLTPNDDVISATNNIKNSIQTFQAISPNVLPPQFQPVFKKYTSVLNQMSIFVDNLAQIVGPTGDRKYLVLFQNNMEIRPGGGFIGSYGILSLHNGRIKDFSIHNVYDSDGQLKGHIEPPFAIRRYIPLVHLYLRDSNFDVDFTKDAKEAAFVLNQETGDTVNGVVAVDLSFVKSLLLKVGGVYLPSYNQTITDKNFFQLSEQYAQQNTFAGSLQKQDFLRSFFDGLKNAFAQKTSFLSPSVFGVVLDDFVQKHILVSFEDPTIQDGFTIAGFSSSLWDNRQNSPNQVNDFLGINEANLGVDKANYFLTRDLTHHIQIDENGKIHETLSIVYKNNSTDEVGIGGVYKNYLRFILPQNTSLDSVMIDGVSQHVVPAVTDPAIYEAQGFVAPLGLEVETTTEDNKSLFGFLVTVKPMTSSIVTIQYTLPTVFPITSQQALYSLEFFKQPGVDNIPYAFTLSYPSSLRVFSGNSNWKEDITSDKLFSIQLTQK